MVTVTATSRPRSANGFSARDHGRAADQRRLQGAATSASLSLVCEEAAAQGAPLLLLVSSAISAEILARYGSRSQQEQWLPGMASGERKVVFAITEPDAGSNTHQLSTAAVRDGGDWVLRGTKYYITGADEADALVVVARTGTEAASGEGLLSLFLVPADAAGLTATELPVSASIPEKQFTLFFDDMRLLASRSPARITAAKRAVQR